MNKLEYKKYTSEDVRTVNSLQYVTEVPSEVIEAACEQCGKKIWRYENEYTLNNCPCGGTVFARRKVDYTPTVSC